MKRIDIDKEQLKKKLVEIKNSADGKKIEIHFKSSDFLTYLNEIETIAATTMSGKPDIEPIRHFILNQLKYLDNLMEFSSYKIYHKKPDLQLNEFIKMKQCFFKCAPELMNKFFNDHGL